MSENVRSYVEEGICYIAFNRPDKKNAVTLEMYRQFADNIRAAESNQQVKVIILCSDNEHFTAGNDLSDFLENPSMDKNSATYQFLQAITTCSLPLIASVTGFAIGIGSTMLLHCEQVFADETAVFSFPFINLGLVPEAGSSLLLPRLTGYKKAADWLMTGESFSAKAAYDAGLVSHLVAEGEVLHSATAYAQKLCEKPRQTLIEIKRLLRRDEEALMDRIDHEVILFSECLDSAPAKEAMTAFLEKRKPKF